MMHVHGQAPSNVMVEVAVTSRLARAESYVHERATRKLVGQHNAVVGRVAKTAEDIAAPLQALTKQRGELPPSKSGATARLCAAVEHADGRQREDGIGEIIRRAVATVANGVEHGCSLPQSVAYRAALCGDRGFRDAPLRVSSPATATHQTV
jgi:hypothetical protein